MKRTTQACRSLVAEFRPLDHNHCADKHRATAADGQEDSMRQGRTPFAKRGLPAGFTVN